MKKSVFFAIAATLLISCGEDKSISGVGPDAVGSVDTDYENHQSDKTVINVEQESVDDDKEHDAVLDDADNGSEIVTDNELELCINILIVDAFIRCKIFENPERYNYAIT